MADVAAGVEGDQLASADQRVDLRRRESRAEELRAGHDAVLQGQQGGDGSEGHDEEIPGAGAGDTRSSRPVDGIGEPRPAQDRTSFPAQASEVSERAGLVARSAGLSLVGSTKR